MANNNSININGYQINSKFFLAPINTGLAKSGNPTRELVSFHTMRSSMYCGINYVGNVSVDEEYVPNSNTLFINPKIRHYSHLATAIKNRGSIPGAQIACLKSKYQPQKKWNNILAEEYKDQIKSEVKKLTFLQIQSIIKSFQRGIVLLHKSGFRAIQIHAAHGYFLNNFISPTYNTRTDEFGKDRMLIIKEILKGIESFRKDIIIDLRISLFEEEFHPFLNVEHMEFLDIAYSLENIDIISISNGIYNINKQLIYPTKKMGNAFMYDIMSDFLKSRQNKTWNISGNVRDLSELVNTPDNITFSIGRPLIADPLFLNKFFNDQSTEIVSCKYTNKCHYYSLNKSHIGCGVNEKVF